MIHASVFAYALALMGAVGSNPRLLAVARFPVRVPLPFRARGQHHRPTGRAAARARARVEEISDEATVALFSQWNAPLRFLQSVRDLAEWPSVASRLAAILTLQALLDTAATQSLAGGPR